MTWQDPKTTDTKLKLRLRPWSKTGTILKVFGVGLTLMFVVTTACLVASPFTKQPATEVFFLLKVVLGLGFLLALYIMIAKIIRLWEKL